MFTSKPSEFLEALARSRATVGASPTLRAALLVRPDGFRVSEESARDNPYMSTRVSVDPGRAARQHRDLADRLVSLGVPTLVVRGEAGCPDGVYPNNVFATIPHKLIVGAMRHPSRRREARRSDIRDLFTRTLGYRLVDLSTRDILAELTGPLVLDRARQIGLCGLSTRADESGARAMHEAFELSLSLRFELRPGEYHTNIVLAVLAGRACVFHPPSFADPEIPRVLEQAYPGASIELSDEEKQSFAGNCLAVSPTDVLLSTTAATALRGVTREAFARLGFRLHAVQVDELEKGGGSLRCMIAEIF